MEHLSIGEFARTTGLTPKALRLYDDLDLLPPAHVDPATGYRWYAPTQLDRARLVARLRLIGMPLARIRALADLTPADAARQIEAYWTQAEADTASRRTLVAALVTDLRSKETFMTGNHHPTLRTRTTVRLGQGGRAHQQDAAFAGTTHLAVADGFGPADGPAHHIVDRLAHLDASAQHHAPRDHPDLGTLLHAASLAPSADSGSTLTAAHLAGDRLHALHIGDSRLHLVRDGQVTHVTRDHTVVAQLVEEGRLTPDEARTHEHRAILNRALGVAGSDTLDTFEIAVRPGDRLVLTTDGVHAVLDPAGLEALMVQGPDPDAVGQTIADAVEAAGAPDNYAVVVADLQAAG